MPQITDPLVAGFMAAASANDRTLIRSKARSDSSLIAQRMQLGARRVSRVSTGRPVMATPRIAAGVLALRDDEILLVRPSYKEYWDVPGGYVQPGESPLSACAREVEEELGVHVDELSLAAVDWAPNGEEGDKLLFLFAAPGLPHIDPEQLTFPDRELTEARYVSIPELDDYTIPRLVRRLTQAAHAVGSGRYPIYLEHGAQPVTTM